jgi:hypothetical protein
MATRKDIVKTFNTLCGASFLWKGMWISDEEWANFVQPDSTILLVTRRRNFNKAIGNDATYGNLFSSEEKNVRGVYRHSKSVEASNGKRRQVSFYYVSKRGEIPPCPADTKDWQEFYRDNLIRVSDRKRKANNDDHQQPQQLQEQESQRARITPIPGAGNQETATIEQSNEQAVGLESVPRVLPTDEIIGRFWEDKQILKIFSVTVLILVTPKFHCELAGEGIEYDWGLSKREYRSLPHESKKGKANFLESLKQSLMKVILVHRRKFSAKARRYSSHTNSSTHKRLLKSVKSAV